MTSPARIGEALDKLFRSSRRDSLNDNSHFVPINIEIARLTLTDVLRKAGTELDDPGLVSSVDSIVDGIAKYVEDKHKSKLDLQNLPSDYYLNQEKYLPAVVYSKGQIVGAMYGSYSKAYGGLFKNYLNKEIYKYLSGRRYDVNLAERAAKAAAEGKVAKEYKIGFDVGHLISSGTDYTVSPAYLKLQDALSAIEDILDGNTTNIGGTDIPAGLISKHRSDISRLRDDIRSQFNFLKDRSSYGTQVAVELQKDIDLNNFLISSKAVVVIAQDRLENQYFFGTNLEGKVVDAVYKILASVNYSKNLIEEYAEGIASVFTGKKHSRVRSNKKLPIIKVEPKSSNINITSGAKRQPQARKPVASVIPKEDPQLQLFSLQAFINQHLQNVISANMGDGLSKDVLNYRTGRFASTVRVESMSKSREGMITAFYSYMKNPYATFSEGGRQQFPRSRDPKLLISKSIRQIAAEKISNKLRAISV